MHLAPIDPLCKWCPWALLWIREHAKKKCNIVKCYYQLLYQWSGKTSLDCFDSKAIKTNESEIFPLTIFISSRVQKELIFGSQLRPSFFAPIFSLFEYLATCLCSCFFQRSTESCHTFLFVVCKESKRAWLLICSVIFRILLNELEIHVSKSKLSLSVSFCSSPYE